MKEDGTGEVKEFLPESTNIKEWWKIKGFTSAFNRAKRINLTESSLEEVKKVIQKAETPTVLSITVQHYSELQERKHHWQTPRLQILFGARDYSKLLKVEYCGNDHYLHGIWYLLLTDLRMLPNILNDPNDIIYVGIGFKTTEKDKDGYLETIHNDNYLMRWGHHPVKCHRFDQGLIMVAEGMFFYRSSTSSAANQYLGEKPAD